MNENPLSHILEYNLDLGKTKPTRSIAMKSIVPSATSPLEERHGKTGPYDLAGKRLPRPQGFVADADHRKR